MTRLFSAFCVLLSAAAFAQVDLAAGTRVRWLPLNPRDQIDVSADARRSRGRSTV